VRGRPVVAVIVVERVLLVELDPREELGARQDFLPLCN
jgi:hypothetical protein